MKTTDRQLMWLGMLLFLLGLLTGLAEQHFTNVRMGLAAHLEGVMNGIFLVALGAIWTEGHLEKFLSPSRCESDSLTARGNGRMEEASHGAEGLFRC
jgi:hypothetical protein